jgi:hypothetical protein
VLRGIRDLPKVEMIASARAMSCQPELTRLSKKTSNLNLRKGKGKTVVAGAAARARPAQ